MSIYDNEPPIGRSHLYLEPASREIQIYIWDEYERTFSFRDTAWGNCEIGKQPGDEVLIDLLHNDLVRRTMAIEQLTLDALTETIPGTAEFARWEHIWGSVAFIRKMTEGMDIGERERLLLQLRAFVSDLGHTAYSHLGDWIFQGVGGPENQHDNELMHLIEVSGIGDILRRHNIGPDEVVFPDIEDWIEKSAPDLCVDRVDYGAREILRWANLSFGVHQACKPEAFKVREDGNLVCVGEANALNFAKAFMLLPTEHWGEPVHRLQLYLKQELVKRVLTSSYTGTVSSDMGPHDKYHPRDYIYSIDSDITQQMHIRDPFLNLVRPLMQDIGLAKRRIFAWDRGSQLAYFFSEYRKKNAYPDPLKPFGHPAYSSVDMMPANIDMLRVKSPEEIDDFGSNDQTFDVFLPSLKARSIDPLFEDAEGKVHRLSEVNAEYKGLLRKQKEMMKRAYVARVHLNPRAKNTLEEGVKENDYKWQEALTRPRMDDEHFRRIMHDVAQLAVTTSLVRTDGGFYT